MECIRDPVSGAGSSPFVVGGLPSSPLSSECISSSRLIIRDGGMNGCGEVGESIESERGRWSMVFRRDIIADVVGQGETISTIMLASLVELGFPFSIACASSAAVLVSNKATAVRKEASSEYSFGINSASTRFFAKSSMLRSAS